MKIPRSKRMRNNASSVMKDKEIRNLLAIRSNDDSNDSNYLLTKHIQLRNNYLKSNNSTIFGTSNVVTNDDQCQYGDHFSPTRNQVSYSSANLYSHQFTMNSDIEKIFMRCNFPKRFPNKIDSDNPVENYVQKDDNDELEAVISSESQMTKIFIKFWNRLMTKQESSSYSIYDHRLSDEEAGYVPCYSNKMFNSPETYIKNEYCLKSRYTGHGHQFLPSIHQFYKISSRTMAKQELNKLFDYYSDTVNQNYLIPIELSSKLSRCLHKNIEIWKQSQACNKINFVCRTRQNNPDEIHPLFTIEYKPSIELEVLPCAGMSIVNMHSRVASSDATFNSQKLQQMIFNYPHLSHFLHRTDAWVDDFYARCWHYSRFFADKLDLGGRINSMTEVLVKDSLFKYLIACSANICVAVKGWLLNPEEATYFRCWCGQKVYDTKQESKMLGKLSIGSARLYNFQQRIKTQDFFHNKHGDKKYSNHICACSKQFADHKMWLAHIFSTKLSDTSKLCPIFIYNFAQQTTHNSRYVCECSTTFCDYDFWSFWLHACGCNVLRGAIKLQCRCNSNNKVYKSVSGSMIGRRSRALKRGKSARSHRSRSRCSGDQKISKVSSDIENDLLNQSDSCKDDKSGKLDKSISLMKECNDQRVDNCQSGDINGLPLKLTKQNNFNNCTSKRMKSDF